LLLERRDKEVTHMVTMGEGKRLLLRALPHLHVKESRVLTDQDDHAIHTAGFGTLVRPGGEKRTALLRRILGGTVCGDARIRFNAEVLAKRLMHRGNLLCRCGDRLLTAITHRIVDASARSLGHADGDQHHSDGNEPSLESPSLRHDVLLSPV